MPVHLFFKSNRYGEEDILRPNEHCQDIKTAYLDNKLEIWYIEVAHIGTVASQYYTQNKY